MEVVEVKCRPWFKEESNWYYRFPRDESFNPFGGLVFFHHSAYCFQTAVNAKNTGHIQWDI